MKTNTFLTFAVFIALCAISTRAQGDPIPPICPVDPNPPVWFDCWDCPYQCHGDVDCQAQTFNILRVYTDDMAVWVNYWKLKDPQYDPRLDFDRDLDIDTCDQAILEQWFGKSGVPPDCPKRPLKLEPIDLNALPTDSTYTIKWTDVPTEYWFGFPGPMAEGSDSCEGPYILEYSIDNGENWLPVDENSVSDTCSYDWVVPEVDSNQCLLIIHDVSHPYCDWEPECWIGPSDMTDELFAIYECQESLPGDRDGNCYVNFGDFAILASTWLIETDANDLSTLAQDWCKCGNPYDPICAD